MPIFSVLLVIEVLTPLNQIIYFKFELIGYHFDQVLVIKWILVQFFQLFGHFVVYVDSCTLAVLLLDELRIFGVTIQFPQPPDLSQTLFAICEGLSLLGVEVEGFGLVRGVNFYLVVGRQDLVVDRAPPIVLYTLIPAFVGIAWLLIKLNIDGSLFLLFLNLIVISGCKRIDIHNRAVNEYLVIDERWEFQTTQTKSDVASRSWVHEMRFSSVDTFQELVRITLVFEVDEIFVISVDPHVGVRSPSPLDLLRSHLILGFELDLFLALKISSPGPLDLDGSNMVHGESVIFEKPSSQGHFVGGLDYSCTEIS